MKRPALFLAATLATVLMLSSCSLGTHPGPKVTPRSLSEARATNEDKKEPLDNKEKPKQTEENQAKEAHVDEYGVDLSIFKPTNRKGIYTTDQKNIPRPQTAATTKPPLPPKEHTTNSLEGAKETAIYFENMVSYAINTGDTLILEDLCSDDSEWCDEFTDRINDLDIIGSWNADYTINAINIQEAKELKGNPAADVELFITVDSNGYKFYDAPKQTLEVYLPTVLHQRITLKYEAWRWVIVDVDKA
ncbi:MAG: DUF6318 family protein [Actinomycetaceae bacterium]|nr:DUF6318 family protein [Actinomycetaceae bacterium]